MATKKATRSTRSKATTTSEKISIKKPVASRSTVVQKTTLVEKVESPRSEAAKSSATSSGFPIKKSYIIGALALLLLIAALYATRSVFVAAMVNGQPVTRLSLVQELEKTGGKQALNSLVTKTLIFQEARKQNVSVSDQEVDAELKKIEKNLSSQGQKLDQVLTLQGMTKAGLIEQVRIQKMIEKMVGKDLKISDKEVADYIADNKETFPAGSNEQQIKSQVTEQLRQQKLNEKVQSWLDKLQKDANINYFVNF